MRLVNKQGKIHRYRGATQLDQLHLSKDIRSIGLDIIGIKNKSIIALIQDGIRAKQGKIPIVIS